MDQNNTNLETLQFCVHVVLLEILVQLSSLSPVAIERERERERERENVCICLCMCFMLAVYVYV